MKLSYFLTNQRFSSDFSIMYIFSKGIFIQHGIVALKLFHFLPHSCHEAGNIL